VDWHGTSLLTTRKQTFAFREEIMTRNISAAVDDMFFASKIRATAEALGVNIKFHRRLDSLILAAEEQSPDLILVDLHNEKISPLEIGRQLKSNESLRAVPLLGFFSHVQTDLQRQALDAGYDQVIPRSVFSRDLAKILADDKQKPDR
jgi:PleD family two-component response regulator